MSNFHSPVCGVPAPERQGDEDSGGTTWRILAPLLSTCCCVLIIALTEQDLSSRPSDLHSGFNSADSRMALVSISRLPSQARSTAPHMAAVTSVAGYTGIINNQTRGSLW